MKTDRQHISPQTSLYLGCLLEGVTHSEDRFFFLSSASLEDISQQTQRYVSEETSELANKVLGHNVSACGCT